MKLCSCCSRTTSLAAAGGDCSARRVSSSAEDPGAVRRVPRMGTRLCGDVATPPAEPLQSTLPRPAGDEERLCTPSVWDGTVPASATVERRVGVSRSTQTDAELTPVVCADVMYTNRANLRHTIAVQQRLFRQQLADRQTAITRPCHEPQDAVATPANPPPQISAKMEWIVRKRSDGSR